jgi:hypothetical protein
MNQSIYFIQCEKTKAVKIGISSDPLKRLGQLQTGSPGKLAILGTIPGNEATEANLHRQFSDRRGHGEWFDLSEEEVAGLVEQTQFNQWRARQKFRLIAKPEYGPGDNFPDIDFILSEACGFAVRVVPFNDSPKCVDEAWSRIYPTLPLDANGEPVVDSSALSIITRKDTGCACDRACQGRTTYIVRFDPEFRGTTFRNSKQYRHVRTFHDLPCEAAAVLLSSWKEWLRLGGDPN